MFKHLAEGQYCAQLKVKSCLEEKRGKKFAANESKVRSLFLMEGQKF